MKIGKLKIGIAAGLLAVLSISIAGSQAGDYGNGLAAEALTSTHTIQVANVEELYSAVNDPANTGATVVLAPGVYMLSAAAPSGAPRANGGRLDLQENMSLLGVAGDRAAVVIDANDLPASSYNVVVIPRVAAIRVGRGSNSIEWLTVRNARLGTANIDTTLQSPGTAYVRIASIASSGSQRGLDVINHVSLGASGETIDAEIVDSDFFDNRLPACQTAPCQGVRVVNFRPTASTINVRMAGNRAWGQQMGRLFANNGSTNSSISVSSAGNRMFANGAGTVVLGANAGNLANGNTLDFQAHGDHFVDNTAAAFPDLAGGLVVIGGDNVSLIPNRVNHNTVTISLWGCRLAENSIADLFAVGARTIPESIGSPGTNNHVSIEFRGEGGSRWKPVEFIADSLPEDASLNNTVNIIR